MKTQPNVRPVCQHAINAATIYRVFLAGVVIIGT